MNIPLFFYTQNVIKHLEKQKMTQENNKKHFNYLNDMYYYFYNLYLKGELTYYDWENFKETKYKIEDWIKLYERKQNK